MILIWYISVSENGDIPYGIPSKMAIGSQKLSIYGISGGPLRLEYLNSPIHAGQTLLTSTNYYSPTKTNVCWDGDVKKRERRMCVCKMSPNVMPAGLFATPFIQQLNI
jgi:hypothetical protein